MLGLPGTLLRSGLLAQNGGESGDRRSRQDLSQAYSTFMTQIPEVKHPVCRKPELSPRLSQPCPYPNLVCGANEVPAQGKMILGTPSGANVSGVIYISVTADARVGVCLSAQERNLVI